MAKRQRKLSNYFRVSILSKGYWLYVLLGGLIFVSVLALYAFKLLGELSVYFDSLPNQIVASAVQDRLIMVAIVFFISFMCFLATTVLYIILLSQRVGGPAVAIVHFIKELKSGKYDSQRNLRKDDELTEIMKELKELAKVLEEREKSTRLSQFPPR